MCIIPKEMLTDHTVYDNDDLLINDGLALVANMGKPSFTPRNQWSSTYKHTSTKTSSS